MWLSANVSFIGIYNILLFGIIVLLLLISVEYLFISLFFSLCIEDSPEDFSVFIFVPV